MAVVAGPADAGGTLSAPAADHERRTSDPAAALRRLGAGDAGILQGRAACERQPHLSPLVSGPAGCCTQLGRQEILQVLACDPLPMLLSLFCSWLAKPVPAIRPG